MQKKKIGKPYKRREPTPAKKKQIEADLKAEDIMVPIPIWEQDYTEEEILYYATPYFDELQHQKELRKEHEKESRNK